MAFESKIYVLGSFRLDMAERCLFHGDICARLTKKPFDLLVLLIEAGGRLQTREELIEALWPRRLIAEHSLTTAVSVLRKTLGDEEKNPRYIQTVHGHGYRLIAPIKRLDGEEALLNETDETPRPESDTGQTLRRPRQLRKQWRVGLAAAIFVAAASALAWRFAVPASSATLPSTTAAWQAPSKSVAVLPFETLDSAKSSAYFTEGLREMILTKLAGIAELKVIGGTSTAGYSSRPNNLASISKRLGVGTVVEGSVEKVGNRIRINVQLINPQTNNTIWAGSYTRMLSDIFEIQSTVAMKIASALRLHLLPGEAKRLSALPTKNAEAYDLFLRGEYEYGRALSTGSKTALEQSITDYRQATRQDPNFALAYARLSMALVDSYHYDYDHSAEQLAAAKAAADKALALAPGLAASHAAKGLWLYLGKRDYKSARQQFTRALALKPQDPMIKLYLGAIARVRGHWANALLQMSAAAKLDPRNIAVLINLAETDAALRRYAAAIALEKRAIAIDPNAALDVAMLANYYIDEGRFDKALSTLHDAPKTLWGNPYIVTVQIKALTLKHDIRTAQQVVAQLKAGGGLKEWFVLAQQSNMLWLSGHRNEARTEFRKLAKRLHAALTNNPQSPMLHAFLGMTYARLGDKQRAIAEGQRAVALVPVEDNSLVAPTYLEDLAEIYAQTGESRKAIHLLHRLLAMPAGNVISVASLKHAPVWAPIRSDADFTTLLANSH